MKNIVTYIFPWLIHIYVQHNTIYCQGGTGGNGHTPISGFRGTLWSASHKATKVSVQSHDKIARDNIIFIEIN